MKKRTSYFLWLQAAFFFCIYSFSALAVLPLTPEFPTPPSIQSKIEYWEKIFFKYPSTSTLIHDFDNPSVLVDIIDFDHLAQKKKTRSFSNYMHDRIVQSYIDRYYLALNRFSRLKKEALKYGAIESRIWSVYSSSEELLTKLYAGKVKIRAQSGLADEFIKAAFRAQDYIPYMEKIFEAANIPPLVTRLAFVESMFQLNAESTQGAVGIWQFMKPTGKRYLHINNMVDERRSPFKATKAAAKFLKNSFEQLQSWPLTITSYNYGLNGIINATKLLQTRSIDIIIDKYRSPSFQFAVKNFYSEFVAAVNIYNRLIDLKRVPPPKDASEIRSFVINRPISVSDILKSSQIKTDVFKKYNPCIKEAAFSHMKDHKLPTPYEIFFPSHLAGFVEKLIVPKFAFATK